MNSEPVRLDVKGQTVNVPVGMTAAAGKLAGVGNGGTVEQLLAPLLQLDVLFLFCLLHPKYLCLYMRHHVHLKNPLLLDNRYNLVESIR